MILFIDIGNSRLKWLLLVQNKNNKVLATRNGSIFLHDIQCSNERFENTLLCQQILQNVQQIKKDLINFVFNEEILIEELVWISVGPKEIEKKVTEILSYLYNNKIPKKILAPKSGKMIFESKGKIITVKCSYDSPNKIGSDRWAALVGLAHIDPPVANLNKNSSEIFLVSAGTATVIDRIFWKKISSRNYIYELKGGMIIPGFTKMLSDMEFINFNKTKKGNLSHYPKNTIDAIKSGVSLCQVSFGNFNNGTVVAHGGSSNDWIEAYNFYCKNDTEVLNFPWVIFEGLYLINEKMKKN